MKKYGGFIPGIRAGKPTEEYLSYVLSRITLPGATYLGLIALIPLIALVLVDANQNFPFGGTSILIMVGVGARHGEADREPAPAAQLRRIPPLMRLDPHGPPRGRARARRRRSSPTTSRSRRSPPATSSGPTSPGAPSSAWRPSATWTPGSTSPTRSPTPMVRDRIALPDAEPGFLLDGYPRTLAQVDELDGMLGELDQRLDAVVVLTADHDELVQRLLQRAQIEGRADDTEDVIRRRQEVYDEQTAPLIEVYDERGLLVAVDGIGEIDDGHPPDLRRARRPGRRGAEPAGDSATRGIEVKTPAQIERMRPPAWWWPNAGSCSPPPPGRASPPASSTPWPRTTSGPAGRRRRSRATRAALPGRICASVNDEVVHGIPGDRRAGRGRHHLDRLRRDRRRLARRRGAHRRGRRGAATRPAS